MNGQKILGSTMLAALALATVGGGKFPPPHRYTGVFVLWFVLGIVAGFGAAAARFCAALSGLVVLTMGMGVSGKRAFAWLSGVGPRLGTAPPASAPSAGGAPATGAIRGLIASADAISSPTAARPRARQRIIRVHHRGGAPDLKDFMYGSTIPGLTPEQVYAAAVRHAPRGSTPVHLVDNGQIKNGTMRIKYKGPAGTNSIQVPVH